ncbi:hypothetical protein DMENIID0001_130880 [Sergentomyia squamirostris]
MMLNQEHLFDNLTDNSHIFDAVSNASVSALAILWPDNTILNSSNNDNTTLFSIDYESSHPVFGRCDPTPNNTNFNCSIEEFLEQMRGPKTLPLVTALMVSILYIVIFVTGIIGNVILCIVIVRHSSMHTATNYYLFNLAVSDLIFLLVVLPIFIALEMATIFTNKPLGVFMGHWRFESGNEIEPK